MTTKSYRRISLAMAIVFGAVGIVFLFFSSEVVVFFNMLSAQLGMQQAEPGDSHFFAILGVAYMYLVTLLALQMYRIPESRVFPFLLVNAKAVSSATSILFFLLDVPLLIYITNGVVDGMIAALVFFMYRRKRGTL